MFGECHGHIFMNGRNYREAVQLHQTGVCREDVRDKLERYHRHGVTFFRDGGDNLSVSEYARSIAGDFGIDYRTPVFAIHKNGHYGSIVGRGFDTMKEYIGLVEEVRSKKGDFIKVMFSGIMDFAHGGAVTGTPLEEQEIREMIRIAHEEGFAVMAHVNGADTIRAAIEAGVDSVEHGNFMDDTCIRTLAHSKAVWVPTHVTISNLSGSGRFPEETIARLTKMQADNIRSAFEQGAMIAAGSDAGAYMVGHATGIEDECRRLKEILGDTEAVEQRLRAGEEQIRKKFCFETL